MLEPITKRMTDNSTEKRFLFIFHCDICDHAWDSVPLEFSAGMKETVPNCQESGLWEREHEAAYERANREAIQHFNRCPVCKRWVCDDCFYIYEAGDACKECSKPGLKIEKFEGKE